MDSLPLNRFFTLIEPGLAVLLCSLKTGSFGTGVFRGDFPRLEGAEEDEC